MKVGEALRVLDQVVRVVERDPVDDAGQVRLDPGHNGAGAQAQPGATQAARQFPLRKFGDDHRGFGSDSARPSRLNSDRTSSIAAGKPESLPVFGPSSRHAAISATLSPSTASRRTHNTSPANGPSKCVLPLRSLRTTNSSFHSRQTIASTGTLRQCGADHNDMESSA